MNSFEKPPHTCGRAVGMIPYGADDRNEVGARFGQERKIVLGDAADGDRGDFHQFGPPAQQAGFGAGLRCLGRGWEEGAEGDVVRPLFGRLHGEVPAVVAGDAEAQAIEQAADVGEAAVGGEVVLAEMGAVASGFECEAGGVV